MSRVFMPVCLSCLRILLCLCVCVCVCVLVFLCDKYCQHLVVSFFFVIITAPGSVVFVFVIITAPGSVVFVVVIVTAPGSVVDLDRRQPHLLQ